MNPGWEDDIEKQDGAHHCLNVLRQAVLCNGDTTLEPSHSELRSNGKEVAAASGMDVLHVCRNWEELQNFCLRLFIIQVRCDAESFIWQMADKFCNIG